MDTDICSIEGCGRPAKGRGWCATHWMRWRVHGDPHAVALPRWTAGEIAKAEALLDQLGARRASSAMIADLAAEIGRTRQAVRGKLSWLRKRRGTRLAPQCKVKGCRALVKARGRCANHYRRDRLNGRLDLVQGKRPRPCSIDGCDRPVAARGWCAYHWRRWHRHGNPTEPSHLPRWSKFEIDAVRDYVHAYPAGTRAPHREAERLAEYLGRSKQSVTVMASKLRKREAARVV